MATMNDAELIAAIEAEAALALDSSISGQLTSDRAAAIDRYKGVGPQAQEGRSAVVSRDLADTIEWIMPSLVRCFLGGGEIGRFEALGPEDEQAAQVETEVCNWMLEAKNDAYTQISVAMKDALLLRVGYLLASWRSTYDVVTETYTGLADEEAAMLLEDDEVKVIEHREYADPSEDVSQGEPADADELPPGMGALPPGTPDVVRQLHDIKVERKRPQEYVAVEAIPPDEILVSHRHRWTSLSDVDFVQWRRRTTIGELRALGYEVDDEVPGLDEDTPEMRARTRFNEYPFSHDDDTGDPARRIVSVHETWLRIDLRGTGKQQLWRICHIAGTFEPLVKEEADVVPIAALTGCLYPHSHIGLSVDDWVSDLADIKTVLMRQALDNAYLQNSNRVVVDVNRVNLDDLLLSRPGGIVRVEGEPGTAVQPIVAPDVGASLLGMLEYVDTVKEARTGVTRYSAGLDANSLNKTATGVQQIQAAANQRIELIARTMATGFRDLFVVMHTLISKHSTRPLQIKLRGQWTVIDPRSWTKRTDFAISVGLGTGTPEQMMMKLQSMMPFMQQAAQLGLVTPTEFYNWGVDYLRAAGYRTPDRFLKQPQPGPNGEPPQMPNTPNPLVAAEQEKGKVAVTVAQLKAQHDAQMASMEAQQKAAGEAARMQADVEVQKHKIATDAQLAAEKAKMDLELQALKHSRDQETALQIEHIRQAGMLEAARIKAGITQGEALTAANAKAAGFDAVIEAEKAQVALDAMMAPHEAIRGPDGRLAGVRRVMPNDGSHLKSLQAQALYKQLAAPRMAVRGPDGKVMGTSHKMPPGMMGPGSDSMQ